jgi:hypothetical protein
MLFFAMPFLFRFQFSIFLLRYFHYFRHFVSLSLFSSPSYAISFHATLYFARCHCQRAFADYADCALRALRERCSLFSPAIAAIAAIFFILPAAPRRHCRFDTFAAAFTPRLTPALLLARHTAAMRA